MFAEGWPWNWEALAGTGMVQTDLTPVMCTFGFVFSYCTKKVNCLRRTEHYYLTGFNVLVRLKRIRILLPPLSPGPHCLELYKYTVKLNFSISTYWGAARSSNKSVLIRSNTGEGRKQEKGEISFALICCMYKISSVLKKEVAFPSSIPEGGSERILANTDALSWEPCLACSRGMLLLALCELDELPSPWHTKSV